MNQRKEKKRMVAVIGGFRGELIRLMTGREVEEHYFEEEEDRED